jgi:hypothetical protein
MLRSALCATLLVSALHTHAQQPANGSADALLHQALAAQGGEAKLRALRSVTVETEGYRNMLEQSERPEGPYLLEFHTVSEVRDYAHDRLRVVDAESTYPLEGHTQGSMLNGNVSMQLFGEHLETKVPGTPQLSQLMHERLALAPERLLLTALDAHARLLPDTTLQDVPQNVVVFDLDGAPVRLYLNAYTHLPTALDYTGPLARSSYEAYRGDATLRMLYSTWWLAKGGIHLPMQIDTETNGLRSGMSIVKKLQIDLPMAKKPTDDGARHPRPTRKRDRTRHLLHPWFLERDIHQTA